MPTTHDDAVWLLKTSTERKNQREKHPLAPLGGFGPNRESTFSHLATAIELDARERQSKGNGTYADVLLEEVCELLRETPGTEKYEAEAVQVAAVALRMASASRALRKAGR